MMELFAVIGSKQIAWTVIGLAGALSVTWWTIKNTYGPRERAFIVRAFAVWWVANVLFVGAVWLVPKPYNWWLFPAYLIPLLLASRYVNLRQATIRAEESDDESA
jgi:hypothetical protein